MRSAHVDKGLHHQRHVTLSSPDIRPCDGRNALKISRIFAVKSTPYLTTVSSLRRLQLRVVPVTVAERSCPCAAVRACRSERVNAGRQVLYTAKGRRSKKTLAQMKYRLGDTTNPLIMACLSALPHLEARWNQLIWRTGIEVRGIEWCRSSYDSDSSTPIRQ